MIVTPANAAALAQGIAQAADPLLGPLNDAHRAVAALIDALREDLEGGAAYAVRERLCGDLKATGSLCLDEGAYWGRCNVVGAGLGDPVLVRRLCEMVETRVPEWTEGTEIVAKAFLVSFEWRPSPQWCAARAAERGEEADDAPERWRA